MKNKIEYDKSFKIDKTDFPFIMLGLKSVNFREEKNGEDYLYKRDDEIIRMRNTNFICDISFKNVDKTLVETAERDYKIK